MTILFGILLSVLSVGAYIDIRYRVIPNWLVLCLLLTGFGSQFWFYHFNGLYLALVGCLAGFLPMFLIHLLTNIGAGDVKLMAAIGSVVGIRAVLAIWFYSYLLSGLAVLLLLAWRRHERRKQIGSTGNDSASSLTEFPLAPGIAIASAYVLWPQIKSGF